MDSLNDIDSNYIVNTLVASTRNFQEKQEKQISNKESNDNSLTELENTTYRFTNENSIVKGLQLTYDHRSYHIHDSLNTSKSFQSSLLLKLYKYICLANLHLQEFRILFIIMIIIYILCFIASLNELLTLANKQLPIIHIYQGLQVLFYIQMVFSIGLVIGIIYLIYYPSSKSQYMNIIAMIILQLVMTIEIILDAFTKSYSYELNDIFHYILLFLQMYFIFVKFRYHQYITYIYDDGSETDIFSSPKISIGGNSILSGNSFLSNNSISLRDSLISNDHRLPRRTNGDEDNGHVSVNVNVNDDALA